jgi:hypothetical protein
MAIQLHRDQVNDQYWLMLKILIFDYVYAQRSYGKWPNE